jgi:hypothetical protein
VADFLLATLPQLLLLLLMYHHHQWNFPSQAFLHMEAPHKHPNVPGRQIRVEVIPVRNLSRDHTVVDTFPEALLETQALVQQQRQTKFVAVPQRQQKKAAAVTRQRQTVVAAVVLVEKPAPAAAHEHEPEPVSGYEPGYAPAPDPVPEYASEPEPVLAFAVIALLHQRECWPYTPFSSAVLSEEVWICPAANYVVSLVARQDSLWM